MILVSKLRGKKFFINPDMIEFMEETPDLVISMISGKKIVVEDSAESLVEKIVEYRQRIMEAFPPALKRDGMTGNGRNRAPESMELCQSSER